MSLLRCILLIGVTLGLVLFACHSYQTSNYERLSVHDVLKEVERHAFPEVDVVLLDPPDVQLATVSIMRFAPFVRRLHVQDFNHNVDPLNYWKSHRSARVVHFSQPLMRYSLSTPFLADHFIVLEPGFALQNYLFPWQLFVRGSPIARSTRGLTTLTRETLNDTAYRSYHSTAEELRDASGRMQYKDNDDHFVPAVDLREVAEPEQLFAYVEPIKELGTPPRIALGVVNWHGDHLEMPSEFDRTLQVWTVLVRADRVQRDAHQRLSFVHRVTAHHNLFIEVIHESDETPEQIGAKVMRSLREMSKGQTFTVTAVFGVNHPLVDSVSNRLAQTYEAPHRLLIPRTDSDVREQSRLASL